MSDGGCIVHVSLSFCRLARTRVLGSRYTCTSTTVVPPSRHTEVHRCHDEFSPVRLMTSDPHALRRPWLTSDPLSLIRHAGGFNSWTFSDTRNNFGHFSLPTTSSMLVDGPSAGSTMEKYVAYHQRELGEHRGRGTLHAPHPQRSLIRMV